VKLYYISLFALVFHLSSFGQEQSGGFHPNFTNYNVDNGLPSNEVYHVLTDKKGMIWIATDNGVCSYDGNKFNTLTTNDGLTDNVVFKFFEDHKGRIWCSTSNHKLCYIFNDSIYPFQYNDVILENVPNNVTNIGLVVDLEGNVHLGYSNTGYYKINTLGKLDHFGSASIFNVEKVGLFVKPIMNEILNFHYPPIDTLYSRRKKYEIRKLKKENNEIATIYSNTNNLGHNIGVDYGTRINDSTLAVIWAGNLYRLKGNDIVTYDKHLNAGIYVKAMDNKVWLGTKQSGVYVYDDDINLVDHFLPNHSVTSVCRDKEGGFWFSTLEDGVFYCPTTSIRSHTKTNANVNALCITPGRDNEMYVGYADGSISKFKSNVSQQYKLKSGDSLNEIFDLSFQNDTLYLELI